MMVPDEDEKKDIADSSWCPLPNHPATYFSAPTTWIDSSDREHIVICADYDDPTTKSHIQSFNTETSKWNDVAAYPKGAKPYRFTTSMDASNGMLYIYGGQYPVFMTYDLKKNEFGIECLNGQYDEQSVAEQKNIRATGWYPSSVFLDNDTLHVFSGLRMF